MECTKEQCGICAECVPQVDGGSGFTNCADAHAAETAGDKMQFTKEQLAFWGEMLVADATADIEGHEAGSLLHEQAAAEKALLEIALAALTAPTEPVYQYRIRNCYNGQVTEWQTIRRDQVDFVLKAQPHNAEFQIITPPAPQLPHPAAPEKMTVEKLPSDIKQLPAATALVWMEGWNACLTAMISGTKGDDHETD